MPNVALHNLLGTTTVTRAISRIKTPISRMQRFFGMQIGGNATNPVGGRTAGWDIMDRTRTIATGRPPMSGPANAAPQSIGHVTAQMARFHEKILLHEEKLFRTRPLGGQFGSVDNRGQRYVTQQEAYLAQRFANAREFMVSRMCRGAFYLKQSGENWIPTDTAGSPASMKVDYRVPTDHFAQLDIGGGGNIITAAWDVTSTKILSHILNLNAKAEEEHGWPIRHIWLTGSMWENVLNNDEIQSIGGSSNTVFSTFTPSGETSVEGIEDTGFRGVLRAIPWLTWHVYDAGLTVDGTFTKIIPNDKVIIVPDPTPDLFEYYEGSEIVARNVMDPGVEQVGFSAWTTRVIDPAGFELKAVDNGLPVVYVPKAIYFPTVDF